MSETLEIALINFAIKFGLDAAIAYAKSRGATIDDAINALESAKTKTLTDYKAEDAALKQTTGLE